MPTLFRLGNCVTHKSKWQLRNKGCTRKQNAAQLPPHARMMAFADKYMQSEQRDAVDVAAIEALMPRVDSV